MNDTEINWNELPEYLIGKEPIDPDSLGQVAGTVLTGGMTSIGRSMSNAVDRAAHTPESLAVFLSMRVYECTKASNRARYWWGRLYNKYTGEPVHYIKLKGLHLIQALRVVDKAPPEGEISIVANCVIRLDFAEEILMVLKKQLTEKSE